MDLADALGLGPEAVVAVVGAGGKKTVMGQLVAAGIARDRRVGYTTTTHTPPPPDLELVLAEAESVRGALPDGLPSPDEPLALAAERVPDPDRAAEKVRGYDPAVVDRLAATERFDWLLVKADGARGREVKAPGPDEPQIPASASLVVPVASVAAVGSPLSEPAVHRPQRVAAITGREPGEPLTVGDLATVLASPNGGLKSVPSSARVVPIVNKADGPADRATSRAVLERAMDATDRFEVGLTTSFRQNELAAVRR